MNVGLIGNGYWGSIVESKLQNLCNLKFVVDSKKEYNSLLNSVDWVFVCSSTNSHYEIVKKCISANKNVFCEKPFTGDYEKAKELINLAKQQNVNIFIDNIFLYREETNNLHNKFKTIDFIWNKSEVINQDICNSLLYHDLYLLIHITKISDWNISKTFIGDYKLEVVLHEKNKLASFFYDRSLTFKEKFILLDDVKIDYSLAKTDPLTDIINLLKNNQLNYSQNNKLTLKTLNLLNKIKQTNQQIVIK